MLITIGPMLASLYLSLTDYNLLQAPNFIGIENYLEMFEDPRLLNSLRVTLVYVLVSVPIQLVVALGIALMLDRGLRGLALPVDLLPAVAPRRLGRVAILWRQVFGTEGLVNACSPSSVSKGRAGSRTPTPR